MGDRGMKVWQISWALPLPPLKTLLVVISTNCTQLANNSRFRKAQRPSGSFTKYFYFPLNDIGMARKSAHRFGIHDFYNFKALNAFAARYFCLNRRIQEGGLTRCAPYSLSNLSRLTAFSSFFPQKVCFCLPN